MKERTVVLMLNEEQTDILNATINDRIDVCAENSDSCDPDDESDAENIKSYDNEIRVLEQLKKQLNPR